MVNNNVHSVFHRGYYVSHIRNKGIRNVPKYYRDKGVIEMITRKIAKQVMEQWERDKQQYGVVVVKTFIEQFPDELTPDEMLAEMREWAKERGNLFRCFDNNHPNMIYCLINIALPLESNKPMIEVDKKDRTEAITEAYRQFKEATK